MEEIQISHLKYRQGVLCTTIPVDLIRSLKNLAKKREVRICNIVIEAIQDLLIKYSK
jgi:REP element-mobilizing transposase RayT